MKKKGIIHTLIVPVILAVVLSFPAQALTSLGDLAFTVPGDANRNGVLNIEDVTAFQRFIAGLLGESDVDLSVADFNGDGKININDATEIQRKLAGLKYNGYIVPDDGYLVSDISGKNDELALDEECIIGYDDIIRERNNGEYFNSSAPEGVALITTPGQFYSLFGCCSPEFDEEFFKNNAAVVVLKRENDWQYENSISYIGVKDKTLLVGVDNVYTGDGSIALPAAPLWCLISRIDKADAEGVDSIAFRIDKTRSQK